MANALQPRIRTFLVLGVVGVPLAVAFVAAQFITDILWFDEVGQVDALLRIRATQLLLVVVVGGLTAAFLIGNARVAVEHAPSPVSLRSIPAIVANSALFAAILGWSARGDWQSFLLWFHQQDFGVEDPLHHSDIGFFVFSLPFLEKLSSLLILILVTGSLVAIFVHVHTGAGLAAAQGHPSARVHLALLGGLALLLLAWRLHLATFAAELSADQAHAAPAVPRARTSSTHTSGSRPSLLSYGRSPSRSRWRRRRSSLPRSRPGREAGGDLPWSLWRRRDRLALVGTGARAALRGSQRPDEGGALPTSTRSPAPARRSACRASTCTATTRRRGSLRGHPARASLARQRPALGHEDPAPPDAAARERDAVLPAGETTVDAVPAGRRPDTVIGPREVDVTTCAARAAGGRTGAWSTPTVRRVPDLRHQDQPTEGPRRTTGRPAATAAHLLRRAAIRRARVGGGQHPPRRVRPTGSRGARRGDSSTRGSGGISLSSPFVRAAFALRPGLTAAAGLEADHRSVADHPPPRRLERLAAGGPFHALGPSPHGARRRGRIVFLAAGYTVSDSYPYSQRTRVAGASANYARPPCRRPSTRTRDAFGSTPPIGRIRSCAPGTPRSLALFEPFRGCLRALGRGCATQALCSTPRPALPAISRHDPGASPAARTAWTLPARLSGPIEVAGNIRFDQERRGRAAAEDEPLLPLRRRPRARTSRACCGSASTARAAVRTSSRRWTDGSPPGEPKLSSRSLPRDRVTPGPAQVSRLVNLTPRIANSLGVRNREAERRRQVVARHHLARRATRRFLRRRDRADTDHLRGIEVAAASPGTMASRSS